MWEATLTQAAELPKQASLGPQVINTLLLQALLVSGADCLCWMQGPLECQALFPGSEAHMLLL